MSNVSAIREKSTSLGDKFQNLPRHPKSEHKVLQRLVKLRSDTGNEGQGLERIFDGIVFTDGNSDPGTGMGATDASTRENSGHLHWLSRTYLGVDSDSILGVYTAKGYLEKAPAGS